MGEKKFFSFQLYVDKAIKKFKDNIYLIDDQNQNKNIKFKDLNWFLNNLGHFLKKKKNYRTKKSFNMLK